MTHARLRAAQGDVAGARAILRSILQRQPGHVAASRALHELGVRRERIARLRRYLHRIERHSMKL